MEAYERCELCGGSVELTDEKEVTTRYGSWELPPEHHVFEEWTCLECGHKVELDYSY